MSAVPRIAALMALALLGAARASAFTMEPMSVLLAPSGAGSIATFRLKNDGTERIAVKLEALTRGVAKDGSELNAPAGDLFVVYPARVLVEPGSQAAVKVQWRGPADVAAEGCFRLRAEEIPLNTGAPRISGIRVMFKYVASLYVGKPSFAADLRASAIGSSGADGSLGFLVEVKNEGKRHVVAEGLSLELSGAEEKGPVLKAEDLGPLSGTNFLPGMARGFFVPDERASLGKRYEARVSYEAEY
jgi:fimbrial chaperone protein